MAPSPDDTAAPSGGLDGLSPLATEVPELVEGPGTRAPGGFDRLSHLAMEVPEPVEGPGTRQTGGLDGLSPLATEVPEPVEGSGTLQTGGSDELSPLATEVPEPVEGPGTRQTGGLDGLSPLATEVPELVEGPGTRAPGGSDELSPLATEVPELVEGPGTRAPGGFDELSPLADDAPAGFRVSLPDFDGPFDLLLTLISRAELDVTEVSLSRVTDEFISYLRAMGPDGDLDEASEFLVVAATLLDMKIAGLLPQGELVDAESVALLEARDLLFARLLQYRAFKEVSAWFARCLQREDKRHTRNVRLDEKYRSAVPELKWTLSADDFAALAVVAFAPKEIPTVGLDHLHAPLISIREQAAIVVTLLRSAGTLNFRDLVAGVTETGVVVARFLAILELYRHAALSFEQLEPLGELTLRWTAERWSEENLAALGADYDR
ncbi:segregation and condensation protein A [Microbacterium testaceum]|nr:segregation and condensation protein A [Microbacterium testaceum]